MADLASLASLATEIAREAGALAKRRRTEGVAIAATKSSLADIVTEADREVEELIRSRIAAERPDDGFLGEESGTTAAGEITWVVDPIDGTVNYAAGIPQYAVSIGIVAGDTPSPDWETIVGVVFNPVTGELFSATQGGGAWLGDAKLHVARVGEAGALLATGFGYNPATHDGDIAAAARALPLARDLRRMGAASLDLAFVAAGRLDGYFERGLQPWDHAAGALLVREAGGIVRFAPADEFGRTLTVASGPELADSLWKAALG